MAVMVASEVGGGEGRGGGSRASLDETGGISQDLKLPSPQNLRQIQTVVLDLTGCAFI